MESIIDSLGVKTIVCHFRGEGRQEGARSALLPVLVRRSFDVHGEVRDRVAAERDLAPLEAWHHAAITAKPLAGLFG